VHESKKLKPVELLMTVFKRKRNAKAAWRWNAPGRRFRAGMERLAKVKAREIQERRRESEFWCYAMTNSGIVD